MILMKAENQEAGDLKKKSFLNELNLITLCLQYTGIGPEQGNEQSTLEFRELTTVELQLLFSVSFSAMTNIMLLFFVSFFLILLMNRRLYM